MEEGMDQTNIDHQNGTKPGNGVLNSGSAPRTVLRRMNSVDQDQYNNVYNYNSSSYGGTPNNGGTPGRPATPQSSNWGSGLNTPTGQPSYGDYNTSMNNMHGGSGLLEVAAGSAAAGPRRSASSSLVLLKGALGRLNSNTSNSLNASNSCTPRKTSGRLSDADDQSCYNNHHSAINSYSYFNGDDPPSARLSASSPLGIPFSMVGPVQIPENDLFTSDVEAARAYAVTIEGGTEFTGNMQEDLESDLPLKDLKPPMPIHLKFIDIKYKVVVKQGAKWRGKESVEKEIVHGITGSVAPGEMLALMGPSGSGKTTLLNLLGSRKSSPETTSGSVLYNDQAYHSKLKRRMGFVTQDDVLFPHLTVRETLRFGAMLRLPRKEEAGRRVEEVVRQLGLERCGDTMIGSQLVRGVSGGERKRVCIAQEVLVDPSLLFLDEPTSGLDSTTALRLLRLLQNMARRGRTVVTTIHQPSSRVFHMFEKLLLLLEGHCVYFGKARGAMTYFDSIGFSPCIAMNPADFFLDLCSGSTQGISLPPHLITQYNTPSKQSNGSLITHDFVMGVPHDHAKDDQDNSTLVTISTTATPLAMPTTPTTTLLANDVKKYLIDCCENQILSLERTKLMDLRKEEDNDKSLEDVDEGDGWHSSSWGTTWWEQFLILLARGLKERRHEYLSILRVVQVVASASLAGCLWWQSKHRTPQELQDQLGLLFFIAVFWGYLPLFTAIFTFPLERAMLSKERASRMYRLSAYFMARILGDLPLDLALPFVFMAILYFMANLLRTPAAFFFSLLTVFLTVITSQGFGLLIGAAMMDVQKATTFASIAVLGFMLAGGFFVEHIPPFIGWIKYLSFQSHTYNVLVEVQYGNNKHYNCSSGGGCESIESSPALSGTSLHGATHSLIAMVIMVFVYRFLAYLALRSMRTAS